MSAPRTIEEVKNDIRERVGHRAPFLHADKAESEQALARIADFSGETWAAAWNDLGAKWEERAKTAEKAGNAADAKSAFLKSYGYYGIARHPFPSTPGKHHGYLKTREMFLAASKYFDIPVEKVSIPFQPKAIVGHLRLPKKLPAPMIMHWGGIDNWKEERHSFGENFVKEGWGCFIIDSPGTGECPMLAGPDAHQVHLAVLEYLLKRPEVDANKIAVVGASFGGHWSTKLAHLAPDKLRATVNWGGGIHYFFQPEWQERSRHADSYLFDLIEARANLFGRKTFDELCAVMPALSLKDSGLLDKPCAPLLIVNGKEDKQVPLEDFYLLLEHGTPKTIRLFPGGHMGAIPNMTKKANEYHQRTRFEIRISDFGRKTGLKVMSLYQLQKLIYHVNRDVERREHYRQDAGAFSQKYDLTEEERAAILNVDVRALYTMGVHSLLLRPFTLLNKVSNEDYAKALKGLV